ncbi:hypothetical protein [Inquilinus limosus]|uniref:Uncharacterized protein n=1 Tax=Inquilinus limosus MP06 TaxID=1398085 RepID=A0A0A0DC96_9PROT|nr:hypothetical protein [Inquilinus limosus]KGM35734.1 hypothetical protein P409_02850 [Inquilinus limosus MP06]
MTSRLIGSEVSFQLAGHGTVRGIVQTYRQLSDSRFAVTALNGNETLSGIVDKTPDGDVATVVDDATADRIAWAILDGRDVRMPIGRQMHALAAAWLSRRGAGR